MPRSNDPPDLLVPLCPPFRPFGPFLSVQLFKCYVTISLDLSNCSRATVMVVSRIDFRRPLAHLCLVLTDDQLRILNDMAMNRNICMEYLVHNHYNDGATIARHDHHVQSSKYHLHRQIKTRPKLTANRFINQSFSITRHFFQQRPRLITFSFCRFAMQKCTTYRFRVPWFVSYFWERPLCSDCSAFCNGKSAPFSLPEFATF